MERSRDLERFSKPRASGWNRLKWQNLRADVINQPLGVHRGVIGLMRRSNAFQDGCFEGWGFVELLPFEHSQGFANDIAFIGVTSGIGSVSMLLAWLLWTNSLRKVNDSTLDTDTAFYP